MHLIPSILLHLALFSCGTTAHPHHGRHGASPLSLQMAQSIISRDQGILVSQEDSSALLQAGFTQKAFYALTRQYPNHTLTPLVAAYIAKSVDSVVPVVSNATKDTTYPLDRLSSGNGVVRAWQQTGEEKYGDAVTALRRSIDLQPKNAEGGLWYYVYPYWSYLDGMYSFAPFISAYNTAFTNSSAELDDMVLQLDLLWQHCYNAQTGLLVHGYDARRTAIWANNVTGASPHVWGRSLGWYCMALIDVLELLPSTAVEARHYVQSRFQQLMPAVVAAVDERTGGWNQVVDQAGREGNYIESSGSSMFIYSLLKGLRLGALAGDMGYRDTAVRAYEYVAGTFVVENGNKTLGWNGTVSVCSLNSTASYETGMDGKDFAKAIGINKPANVRDKIKRWQQEVEPDAASTDDATASAPETSKPSPAPSPSPKPPTAPKAKALDDKPNWKPTTHTRGKSVGASPERPSSAKKTPVPHNELDEDVHSATAPKKRVISDSHWRAKQPPPKDAAGRPQPKTIPNAWVRPSRIIPKKPASPELKPIAPVVPQQNPLLPFAEYVGRSTGQTKPPPKQRRPSKPSSSGSDQRPTSSGAGSGKGAKSEGAPASSTSPKTEKDKTEMVRMRPSRRRARTSPRGSMSADDLARYPQRQARRSETALSEDPNRMVTVEYDEESAVTSPPESKITSPRNDELRERRRRRRPRSQGAHTGDEAATNHQKPSRRKSRRSYPRTHEEAATPLTLPAADTPPAKPAGSRLEAWLSGTPDAFGESKPSRRRSKDSTSSLDLPSKVGTSEVTLSTAMTEEIPVKKTRSRRRRKSNQSASSPELPAAADRSDVTLSTQTTQDEPAKQSRRKKSKDSVSSLDLPSQVGKSDVSASTEKDEPYSRRSSGSGSGSGSRRRRRRSSRDMTIDTQNIDDAPSAVTSDTMTESTAQDKDSEVSVTPTPSLKRRGARRKSQYSPTKGRSMSSPLRETTSIDDMPRVDDPDQEADSAVPSSSAEPLSPDLMPKPLRPRQILGPRMFPSTGKRLSTIASQSTRSSGTGASDTMTAISEDTIGPLAAPASEVGSLLNPETSTIISRQSTRRRKLARHDDLMSVLSMPKAAGSKSIVSARSIRTNRSRLATATVEDIMKELASDEAKYMRELRTIVDGVIPVLLSCVLNKSESAIAAGLFSRSSKPSDPSEVTKPIVDMGVCLERLKNLHKRVPKEDSEALVSWAQSAHRVYSDYISVWRLGFQDVVISLAPADEDPFKPAKVVNGPEDGAPWDEGMPRNAEGYVVNSDGERVDVAYMLKRPLVRLKYLSKSLKGINHVKPSEHVEKVSGIFQDLVTAARKRSNDEQARLEDEAAASIDPTRARDPRSLAPLAGVRVDPSRCVRARDHFDLHLYHSSGQEMSCRVEILLRDNAPGQGVGGDLLFCEVDSTGRWLLLPPVHLSNASSRNGDLKGEIIVMIRGKQADGSEWSEVMSLISDDEQAGFEWVQMLGLNPIPPQIAEVRKNQAAPSQTHRPSSSHGSSSLLSAATDSTPPQKSRTPSPHEIDIPIGEQHTEVSKVWHYDTPDKRNQSRTVSPVTSPSGDGSITSNPYDAKDQSEPRTPIEQLFTPGQLPNDADRTPRGLEEAVRMANSGSPSSLKRTRAKRLSKNPSSARPSRQITLDDPTEPEEVKPAQEPIKPRRKSTKRRPQYSVWMPTSEINDSDSSEESEEDSRTITDSELSPPGSPPSPQRPQAHRRVSSVPSLELPSIPRQRKSSRPSTPSQDDMEVEDECETSSSPLKVHKKKHSIVVEDIAEPEMETAQPPPPTPPHRSPSPATPEIIKGTKTPVLTPTPLGFKNKRRSSSPLKHEYEPSTCTEESSESEEDSPSEGEVDEEEEDSLTSESSEDDLDDDVPMPLMPIGYIGPRGYSGHPYTTGRENSNPATAEKPEEETKKFPKVSPPASIYTLPNGTITPSQSASNSPYRAVPQSSGKASRTIASLFAWSDSGKWDSLHPDECSIVVTPGKIQVFEISSNHSKPFLADGDEIITPEGGAPLIEVELTPLVPLRKSTAIDISIRSPPTADSRIKPGNNIMLRSRSAAECTQLYSMINQSRINNPTYIALQNARGPYGQSSWAEAMDRQNAARTSTDTSGWLGGTLGRRSSYRKSSTRAASISAATESSVGTMNSALRSALSRFSFSKGGVFSIRNSTLGSRSDGSSFDSGSNSRHGSGASTPTGDIVRAPGAPAGITNTKCRLYERESLKKWRDMGSARLTIMLPSPNPSVPSSPTNARQRAPGTRDHRQERRILLTGKKHGEVLLDVTLSETCFERVARSGIAVSVWEDNVDEDGQIGGVGKTGGVLGARARIFMVQMKSERECAYCFSLLGKLRY
ncbi:glycoside hydrolase family 105 protein [Stemphylium lycopersici]|nr:glycoside hydrolase family 105 protein [Stemphylium lycopersici]RAR09002.1 glycoside hydrolase family 105 protein [Stemphylium lycopersici]